ncbi:MAG: hypothetical protein QF692_04225 [Alphaproteobacteria bacterium]|nr:hypothetical protein [Alphaproteobacteria bacterium]MDP7222454.1 hypothetical protein [Alphaproteobacteria bacterium]
MFETQTDIATEKSITQDAAADAREDIGVTAAFGSNCAGEVYITFSDTYYAGGDYVTVCKEEASVFVTIDYKEYFVGYVSDQMIETLTVQDDVLLTAVKTDGLCCENKVPIKIS